MAKNLLKVWLADNTVTTDDKTDKIFVLESTRSVDQDFVLDRQASMYINGTQDATTRATDYTATAGRNFTLLGKNIKVAGTDPSVGITLKSSGGTVTKITNDMIAQNDPSKIIILLPTGLSDGTYTLTITTQYTPSKSLLKTPRTASQTIYIGEAPSGGGSNPDDNPLG